MPCQNACNDWRHPPRHGPPVHYHAINPADLVVEERLPLAGVEGERIGKVGDLGLVDIEFFRILVVAVI
jgi:hypothetical protein